jgi:hypothetical protein
VNERPLIDSPPLKIPISRAIASAVGWVSPVIMMTRMPAVAHEAMAHEAADTEVALAAEAAEETA